MTPQHKRLIELGTVRNLRHVVDDGTLANDEAHLGRLARVQALRFDERSECLEVFGDRHLVLFAAQL
ncbi:hypothetical protein D3C87_1988680 [compost metagenome]